MGDELKGLDWPYSDEYRLIKREWHVQTEDLPIQLNCMTCGKEMFNREGDGVWLYDPIEKIGRAVCDGCIRYAVMLMDKAVLEVTLEVKPPCTQCFEAIDHKGTGKLCRRCQRAKDLAEGDELAGLNKGK